MIRLARMRGKIVRFAAARGGTALIEFAIVLPVTLALYLGGFQLSDAIACNRKVTVTTRAVADLTSQYVSVTQSQLNTILGASAQVMSPYSTSSALIRVSEVTVNPNYTASVTWSQAINGSRRPVGSAYALPTLLLYPGLVYIVSEVTYPYTPMVRFGMVQPVTLSQTIDMMPRSSISIPCTDCSAT